VTTEFDPMPEYTKVDYLCTFEHIHGDEGRETTIAEDATFVNTLAERLQPIFPNAEIYVRLDGYQYATRGSEFEGGPADDAESLELDNWAEYVCDQVASTVAGEVFPDPEPEEDDTDFIPTGNYCTSCQNEVMQDPGLLTNYLCACFAGPIPAPSGVPCQCRTSQGSEYAGAQSWSYVDCSSCPVHREV
jgi:hypothetical protein